MMVHIYRTAMIGGGLAYDVNVLAESVPEHNQKASYRIIRDGCTYLTYVDATLPIEHFDRPTGEERYAAYQRREREASEETLMLAQRAFPELKAITPEAWNQRLWFTDLGVPETHATAACFVDSPANPR